eukprot:TRINITY_DN4106_c0_g1_i1.p1 TRINITY_DN4106_c0_g1~~TRINITY_DN4106_c0_g1_i1.p1  ORF type:complete len:1010 (-),score=207.73 TRINITY_DN4106_c0_g1_i1:315-3344(-)
MHILGKELQLICAKFGRPFCVSQRRVATMKNSNRGGRRGEVSGGASRGRGGRGGEKQRWWDPAWRAERLRQIRESRPVEKIDENEWRMKMENLSVQQEEEIVIKKNYGREGALILEQLANQMGFYFHAYNRGRAFVISKVPLPNYRADLDEKHGSIKRQISISDDVKCKMETMLDNAKNTEIYGSMGVGSGIDSGSKSYVQSEDFTPNTASAFDTEKLNNDLYKKQNSLRMMPTVKAMLSFRERLPAYKMKAKLLHAVRENQVIVVSGETGCGKTTQLPQMILEEQINSMKGAYCNIICTQPRRVSAISVATRVAEERGERLGEMVGYQIRLESEKSSQTRLLYCTTGVLLRRLIQDPNLKGVSHVIVDEIHERGMNEDFLIIILRDLVRRRCDLRLILMSATINAELFSEYFGAAPVIHIPGFTFHVKELFLEDILETTRYAISSDGNSKQDGSRRRGKEADKRKDSLVQLFEEIDIDSTYKRYSLQTRKSLEAWNGSELDLKLVEAAIMHICFNEGDGAILVFLAGWDEISKLYDSLNTKLADREKFWLLPLHGSMPTVNQREIFQRPPKGVRKIILATNIAETSITIDDVVFVVDCGKSKETSYDALNKLACLLPSWISKASAHQRRGRAGRVQSGVCYHLYPRIIYDNMAEYQLPEMLRTPLQELCLQIKSLQLGKVSCFLSKALQPPEALAVQNAIELLITIGALDENEELTSLGRHLAKLPVDPKVGKMLLMGAVFQCLEPALVIASALSYRDPFVLPIDKKELVQDVKKHFAGDSCSDHICLWRAFKSWQAAKCSGKNIRQFCYHHFLSAPTLQLMEDMQNQLYQLLVDIGFIDKSTPEVYNHYSGDLEMVSAILCAGLFPSVVLCKRRGKRCAFFTKEDGKVDIHPSSVNAQADKMPLPYLIYSNKVKTASIYIRETTNISDHALLMFGAQFSPNQNGEGISMLGGYLQFSASKNTLQLVQSLRNELDRLLQRKIEQPSLDITVIGKGIVSAVIEFLHSAL